MHLEWLVKKYNIKGYEKGKNALLYHFPNKVKNTSYHSPGVSTNNYFHYK